MDFYLVALTGPLKGQRVALAEATEWTLGRHRSNRLHLPEPAVSRRHAVLRSTEGDWRLCDLDSRGGTFVNGRPIHEATLAPGDLVVIAGSTFLFTGQEAAPAPREAPKEAPALPEIADLDFDAATALHVAVDDSLYLRGGRESALAAVGDGALGDGALGDGAVGDGESRRVRALAALLAIGLSGEQEGDLEALATVLLERTLAAVPAERAILAVLDGATLEGVRLDGSRLDAPQLFYRQAPSVAPAGAPRLSRTVLERVVATGRALFWDRAWHEAASESVLHGGVEALAALPLGRREQPAAVLYLDVTRPGAGFGQEDRDLLLAIAAMGGATLDNALRVARLERENRRLRDAELGHGLVGESEPMRRVFELLARVAPTDSTLLLLGESGTGKELAARAVHAQSRRADGPFIAINCATLQESLLESELFGHEKGAFTGAVARKPGKLELAQGGTLFLDEVGELPLQVQARLLRVLQERTFERVGGTQSLRADVRLVAATNRDLEAAIRDGGFREDLYYRLNVIAVTLSPLRERSGDVALLARHFAARHGGLVHGRPWGIAPEALALLASYRWPGNVRELSNAIERAVVLGQDELIGPDDLPETLLEGQTGTAAVPRFHDALNRHKQKLIREALVSSEGNVTRAAETLGLHPNHLHRLITTLGLRDEPGR